MQCTGCQTKHTAAADSIVREHSCTALLVVASMYISISEGKGKCATATRLPAKHRTMQCSVHPSEYSHYTQSRLKTITPRHVVDVWACSARDAGVDALRMEALAPSAKRSKTGEAAAQPAGQPERPAAKYASVEPLIVFATCMYMHQTVTLAKYQWVGLARARGGWGWA